MEATLRIQPEAECKRVYGTMYMPEHLCAKNGTKVSAIMYQTLRLILCCINNINLIYVVFFQFLNSCTIESMSG